ncbi:hypothetical protein QB607_003094 [Clostridium botulinum]|nr:hypothetical protein [Clostridium botulinum]EKS4395767.1 hypothetical protein [Clostridium botulinum]
MFLDMALTYDQRKVDNTEGIDKENIPFIIDTCKVTDSEKPYETALSHRKYKNGMWVILEQYNTKEEAKIGHSKWLNIFLNDKPEFIMDIPAGFEDILDTEKVFRS